MHLSSILKGTELYNQLLTEGVPALENAREIIKRENITGLQADQAIVAAIGSVAVNLCLQRLKDLRDEKAS